jgi:hypothetical protein
MPLQEALREKRQILRLHHAISLALAISCRSVHGRPERFLWAALIAAEGEPIRANHLLYEQRSCHAAAACTVHPGSMRVRGLFIIAYALLLSMKATHAAAYSQRVVLRGMDMPRGGILTD